jgi:PilZ domain
MIEQSMQIDLRREPRFNVHWRAQVRLPDGPVIELRVKDISDSGMGLAADQPVPAAATLDVCVQVPDPGNPAQMIVVTGKIKVAYVAMRGYEFRIGATWAERDDAGRELMSRWMRKVHFGF